MTTITFKKVTTKLIVTISVIAMMFCFGGINASASTKAQDIAHQNAENARLNFGMVDNSLPVRSQSLLWWYESGNTFAAKSWFYDALEAKYFDFFGNEIQNPNVSNSSSSNNSTNSNYRGDTISYGSYTWTWDGSQYYRWENGKKIALSNQSNQSQSYTTSHTSNGIAFEWDDYRWYQTNDGKFYRWDGKGDNKKIVWATSKENEKILKKGDYLGNTYYDTYTTSEAGRPSEKYQYWDGKYTWYQDASTGRYYRWEGNTKIWWDSQNSSSSNQNQNNSNQNQNNNNSNLNENMFSGYNFHSGVINPPSDSWTDGQAKLLVQMTYPYIKDLTSQTSQAQMMWVALNVANGSDLSNATSAFPEFNASLDAANAKDSSGRSLMALAKDVLFRDKAERNKWSDNGRVLPSQYTYFSITGQKTVFKTSDGTVYNNILKTPYTS